MTQMVRIQDSTATFNPDVIPVSVTLSPSTLNVPPEDTRTPTFVFLAANGRPLDLAPTSWEIVSGSGLTLNTSTGLITGVTEDEFITLRALYAPQSLTSNTITAVCSLYVNEPDNMTPLLIHDGTSVEMDGMWAEGWRAQTTSTYELGQFEIDTDATEMKTVRTMKYKIAGVEYEKAPTSGIQFSAAHTVSAGSFGAIIIQINAAGVISTIAPSDPQEYEAYNNQFGPPPTSAYTAAFNLAPTAGNVKCGVVAIFAGETDWVAGVDDLSWGPDGPQEDYRDTGSTNGNTSDPPVERYAVPTDWSGGVRCVNDPTYPGTETDVLELRIGPIITAGSGGARMDSTYPQTFAVNTFGATRVYIACWMKVSAGYRGNAEITPGATANPGAGALKNMIMNEADDQFQGGAVHFPAMINNPTEPAATANIYPGISLPGFPGVREHDGIESPGPEFSQVVTGYIPSEGEAGTPGDIMERETWHFVEGVITFNSIDTADGQAQLWVDGVEYPPVSAPTLNFVDGVLLEGIRWTRDGMRFASLEIDTTWGGGGPNVPAPDHSKFIGGLYVSGGFARAGERPDHWVVTAAGAATTIGQGDSLLITAQLVDENDVPVSFYGLYPKFFTLDGVDSAAWPSSGTGANGGWTQFGASAQGIYQFTLTADVDASIGQDITIAVRSYPRILDAAGEMIEGDVQSSNTLSLEIVA